MLVYTCSGGLNSHGAEVSRSSRIGRVVGGVAQEPSAERPRSPRGLPLDLGGRLRSARSARDVTLRELARRAGVSPSLVSQLETGKSGASLATLYQLASCLGVPLNSLLFEPLADGRRPASRARRARGVVRQADRRRIEVRPGVTWYRLTATPDEFVDFLYVVYEPGAASADAAEPLEHGGREYGFVLRGSLAITVGLRAFEIGAGDSVAFESTTPHRLANEGHEPVHALWFVLGRTPGRRTP